MMTRNSKITSVVHEQSNTPQLRTDKRHRFDRIADSFLIQRQQDWYSISSKTLQKALRFSTQKDSWTLLQEVYPEYVWNKWQFKDLSLHYWKQKQTQTRFVEWLEEELDLRKKEDWYKVTLSEVMDRNGSTILSLYFNSSYKLLQAVFPNYKWIPWLFERVPFNYWTQIENQKQFFDWYAEQIGIRQQEDWYNVTTREVGITGGGVLKPYKDSLFHALCTIYPQFDWIPLPLRSSVNTESLRSALSEVAESIEVERQEDWYSVTEEELSSTDFASICNLSLPNSLQMLFAEFIWYPWLFTQHSPSIWNDEQQQRMYLDWIAEETGIESQQQWYLIVREDLQDRKGGKLLHRYNNSVVSLLQQVYREYEWYPWLFEMTPSRFWHHLENQKFFFDWLAKELSIDTLEQWYNITCEQVREKGGAGLIAHFGGSLKAALEAVFPDNEWHSWLFQQSPRFFWTNLDNQKLTLDWLARNLQLEKQPEWYNITRRAARRAGVGGIMSFFGGSLLRSLRNTFPQYEWRNAVSTISQGQQHVLDLLKSFVPEDLEMVVNYKNPLMRHSISNSPVELDIFFPSLKIALEYQGQQHYQQIHFYRTALRDQQRRDAEKRELCKQMGISLIEIPCWFILPSATLLSALQKLSPVFLPSQKMTASSEQHS